MITERVRNCVPKMAKEGPYLRKPEEIVALRMDIKNPKKN